MFSSGKGLRPTENNLRRRHEYDRNESYAVSCTSHCVIRRRRRIRLIIIIAAAARNHCARRQWFLQQNRPTVMYIRLTFFSLHLLIASYYRRSRVIKLYKTSRFIFFREYRTPGQYIRIIIYNIACIYIYIYICVYRMSRRVNI